jgi:hypothetical protein
VSGLVAAAFVSRVSPRLTDFFVSESAPLLSREDSERRAKSTEGTYTVGGGVSNANVSFAKTRFENEFVSGVLAETAVFFPSVSSEISSTPTAARTASRHRSTDPWRPRDAPEILQREQVTALHPDTSRAGDELLVVVFVQKLVGGVVPVQTRVIRS